MYISKRVSRLFRENKANVSELPVVALPLSYLLKLSGLWQFDANVYSIKLFQENF